MNGELVAAIQGDGREHETNGCGFAYRQSPLESAGVKRIWGGNETSDE